MKALKALACGAAVALAAYSLPARAQAVDAGQWINLFDGETTFGWINTGANTVWEVKDGELTASQGSGGALMTTTEFTDFELQLSVKISNPGTVGVVVRSPLEGNPVENGAGVLTIAGAEGDAAWHNVRVVARGTDVTATVDDKKDESFKASNALGHIGILYHKRQKDQPTVEVKDVKLRPLQLTPIFNGTDLTGWNVIPGHDSEFSVVDGAIRILHGNGQIETDAVWKNFLVQMDIYSAGDHLNSGVFFRSPKGVFWKGYESQVRNQWQGEDRTKPVDTGTGGIYGIQDTRKVVPSDREWFTKTIVANGNHFAVWINGYQVADMFDTRPVNEESDAKAGYVPTAGTINLQGHDKTTDLSFKNINLQSYPGNN